MRTPLWRRPLAWVAAATTVLALVVSLERLYDAWSGSRARAAAVAEQVASARTLAAAGDYPTAWRVLVEAQGVDPEASEIGVAQIEIGSDWLLSVGTPIGWVPSGRESRAAGDHSGGAVADSVYLPLVTAAVFATGADRAELEALAAWARYLRGRELRGRRRDIVPDLEAALAHDPDAYYPNLFLGFWQVAIREEPGAARQPWARARATEILRELEPRVRDFQLYTLGDTVRRASTSNQNQAANSVARAMYLQVLDEMRRSGESPEDRIYAQTYTALYLEPSARDDHFAEMFDAMALDDQLAVAEWLLDALALAPKSYAGEFERVQLIRGRLHEAAGQVEAGTQAIAAARTGKTHGRLGDRIDAAWSRLTGEQLVPGDEWAARAHHLKRSAFDGVEVREALLTLGRGWPDLDSGWSFELPKTVDAAIARVTGELAASIDAAEIAGFARGDLETLLRTLRHLRAALLLERQDFAGGTRELEALLRDPALATRLRQRILFDLAYAYADTPRAVRVAALQSDAEQAVTQVYVSEGLDRLAAALEAGFSDWDEIEARLGELRADSSYVALSLRHNRVPPRDDD